MASGRTTAALTRLAGVATKTYPLPPAGWPIFMEGRYLLAANPLNLFPPTDDRLYAIYPSNDHSDVGGRVYAFSLYHFASGRQWQYCAETLAHNGLTAAQIRANPDSQESAVLRKLADFAAEHPEAMYVHWRCGRHHYGFEHWARRAKLHAIEPWPRFDAANTLDLEVRLRNEYGADHYGPSPHFHAAMRNNNIDLDGVLDSDAAKKAGENRDWDAINVSLMQKTVALHKLYLVVWRGEYWFPGRTNGKAPQGNGLATLTEAERAADEAIRAGADSLKTISKKTGIAVKTLSVHVIPALKRKRGLLSKPYRYG